MKKLIVAIIFSALLVSLLVFPAMAAGIKTNGLNEVKLYDLYSQVNSQIQLNRMGDLGDYKSLTSYDDFERNPGKHKGDKVHFSGKVVQVLEGTFSSVYRVAVNKNSDQVFYLTYKRPSDAERILDDDLVEVYATFTDLETYTSTTNLSVTVPAGEAALIIRPVTDAAVKKASDAELTEAVDNIRAALEKTAKKEKEYRKLTKTNYTDYARHEKLHENEKVTISGKVLQVVESSSRNTIRLAVDSDSNQVVYLTVDPSVSEYRLLDDDSITVKGTYTGLYTYSSTRGGEITIPSCSVESISLKGYTVPKSFPKDKNGNVKLTKKLFEDYSRRPSVHEGEGITFSAKVVQVLEGSTSSEYRLAVDSDSNYVIYAILPKEAQGSRVLEDDKVTVTATFTGLLTYESTMGVPITIPKCTASEITIPGKKTQAANKDSSGVYKVTKKTYEAFARDGASYEGKPVSFTARVVQVVESSGTTIFRLAVDKDYDAMFLGTLDDADRTIRILEDDIVKVEATSTGLYTYSSTMGGKITIPSCKITKYTVNGYKKGNVGKPDKSGYYKVTKANFDEYARNPDEHKGKQITFKAKVLQVVERSSGPNIYRVAVDSDSNKVFYVEYTLPSGKSRILEKDVVTLKGEFYGIYTYETTMGSSVSVPALLASDMKK